MYVKIHATICANIHLYVRARNNTYRNIIKFKITQIIGTHTRK